VTTGVTHRILAMAAFVATLLQSHSGFARPARSCNGKKPRELARLGNRHAAAAAYRRLLSRETCPTEVWISALTAAVRVDRLDLINWFLAHLSHVSHLTKAQASLVARTKARSIAANELLTRAQIWPRTGLSSARSRDTWWALPAVAGRRQAGIAVGAPIQRAPITTNGKTFYVSDLAGHVHAVHRSGILWSKRLPASQSGPALLWNHRLFVPLVDGSIICLNRKDGAIAWKARLGREPCTNLTVDAQGRFWALCGDLHVLNRRGALLARLAQGPCRAGPTLWGPDCVALGCRNGAIERICLNQASVAGKKLHSKRIAQCGADVTRVVVTSSLAVVATAEPARLCVADAKRGILWQTVTPGRPTAGPLLDQHRILIATADGAVVAYSLHGTMVAQFRGPNPVPCHSRLVLDRQHNLYLGFRNGHLSSLNKDLHLRWSIDLYSADVDAGPCLVPGGLVLGTETGTLLFIR